MSNVTSIYSGKDPRELPFYTVTDVANFLHVPRSTISGWCGRKTYPVGEGGRKRMKPVFPVDSKTRYLTFHNLVEVYVVSSLTRTFQIPLPSLRVALDGLGTNRPLLDHIFYASTGEVFIEAVDKVLIDVYRSPGQAVLRRVLESSVQRIELDAAKRPERLYPWRGSITEPMIVAIDARRAFGRPTVKDRGLKVEVLVDLSRAGETVESIARNYEMDEALVRSVLVWGGYGAEAAA